MNGVTIKKRAAAMLMSLVLLVLPMMQIGLGGGTAYAAAETKAWSDITGSAGLSTPTGMAVSSDGTLYVIDAGTLTMKKLSSAPGSEWENVALRAGILTPKGIAVSNDGTVYVLDINYSNNLNVIYKLSNEPGSAWVEVAGSVFYGNLNGIAVDSNGTLYAADYSSGGYILALPSQPDSGWLNISGSGGFFYPGGVAVDSNDTLYVADSGNSQIKKRSGNAWVNVTGAAGDYFNNPLSLVVDSDGTLYVADSYNARIKQRSSASGSAWQDVSGTAGFTFTKSVAVHDGTVYVVDGNSRIMKGSTAYTVSFNSNDGSDVDDQVVLAGEYATEPEDAPTKDDYVFGGWYSSADFDGEPFDFATTAITEPLTLNAKWISTAKAITSFDFEDFDPAVIGSVDDSDGTIVLTVPYDTDVTELVPTFATTGVSVKVDGTTQTSGITAQDFTDSVTYTVEAEDGSTQDYTVWVNVAANSAKAITAFGFAGLNPSVTGTIDETNKTIALTVPYGTNVTSLVPTFAITGANAQVGGYRQASGETPQDFTAPVVYKVVAEDESTQDYTVTVTVAASPAKAITAFGFAGLNPAVTGTVNETNKTIALTVPYGTNVTSLVPTFAITGANVQVGGYRQASGETPQDFTAPVVYKVVAEDESTQDYTVTVTVAAAPPVTGNGGGTLPATSSNAPVISTNGTLALPVGKSGEVSLGDGVKVIIPADASAKDLKVTIEKLADAQKLFANKDALVSAVFEILKNFPENFNKEITLVFTFDPAGVKGNQKPSVYFYDEVKKVWVEVGGAVQGNTITVKVNHFTKYAVFAASPNEDPATGTKPPVNLSDIAGHWAEASIKQAVSLGIVGGYPDGTFSPNSTVTRAEFAVMLMNALKPQGEGAELIFADKGKIGTWAQRSVAQAVQAGILTGYEDGTFRPNAEITRSEMAVMIAKALGQAAEAATATGFADDKDIPNWAKGAVEAMKERGIIQGKGANAFAPGDKTTRAEAVTVLLKMLAQKGK